MTSSNMTIMGIKFHQYKIDYLDSHDMLSGIYFWTTIISSRINEFEEDVRKVNPYLIVEHYANE